MIIGTWIFLPNVFHSSGYKFISILLCFLGFLFITSSNWLFMEFFHKNNSVSQEEKSDFLYIYPLLSNVFFEHFMFSGKGDGGAIIFWRGRDYDFFF